ncbi:hypothetical protein OE810_13260 [Rhodobacteraceae bacterium XHP0102]|nr:hypothetical protein [Rhodobacteraceae bacterium XHP0102]
MDDPRTSFYKYLNARPLDVHTWSEHPEVNEFVNEIYKTLSSVTGNERINKRLLKVLLLDLFIAWKDDPDLMIMFSRDNNSYKAKSRYNEIKIGKKMIEVVDLLHANGVIEVKNGFNDRISGVGFQTRLWPSECLIEKFHHARFSKFDTSSHEGRETIILRDDDKNDVEEYEDTPETHRMRTLMTDYNALLDQTHIDICTLDKPVIVTGKRKRKQTLQIDQKDKFVRRVFNESRWDKGGRFYGGWWQRCPSEYRKSITIDSYMTSEIDFSGLHIVILYAQEGINYWQEINEDPYQLMINDYDPNIDLRQAAKLLLLTAINAKEEKAAFAAFRRQAEKDTPEKRLTNEQLKSLLTALQRKHQPIAHKIASGAGIDLMNVDGQITEKLIERFTYHYKCPILTVHDSYIVPFGYDRYLYREMQQAFEEVTGVTDPVAKHTTEYYDIVENEPHPPVPEQDRGQPSPRHLNDWEEFKLVKRKPEFESWYPTWTYVY